MNENFICLRCGFCCYSWSIIELNKPEKEFCKHLEYREEEGKPIAYCKIYEDRPEECRVFAPAGPDGVCIIGKTIGNKMRTKLYEMWKNSKT